MLNNIDLFVCGTTTGTALPKTYVMLDFIIMQVTSTTILTQSDLKLMKDTNININLMSNCYSMTATTCILAKAVLEESMGGGARQKVDDLFSSSPLKYMPKLPNQSLQPSKNAPCITVCWFYYKQNIWGQGSGLGDNPPAPT